MTSKGLIVEVFRAKGMDCTNGGDSSRYDNFTLVGFNPLTNMPVGGPFEPAADRPALLLVKGPFDTLRAVPEHLVTENAWVMFGGHFIYSSDSRFPSDQPIKIFDRVEKATQ